MQARIVQTIVILLVVCGVADACHTTLLIKPTHAKMLCYRRETRSGYCMSRDSVMNFVNKRGIKPGDLVDCPPWLYANYCDYESSDNEEVCDLRVQIIHNGEVLGGRDYYPKAEYYNSAVVDYKPYDKAVSLTTESCSNRIRMQFYDWDRGPNKDEKLGWTDIDFNLALDEPGTDGRIPAIVSDYRYSPVIGPTWNATFWKADRRNRDCYYIWFEGHVHIWKAK